MLDTDPATINRHLILIVPKQAALDWIMSVDQQPLEGLSLDQLSQEQEAYLVSEGTINTPEQAQQWALQRFSVLFDSFLNSWFVDQALWPKRRTRKMFLDWFEVQFHSTLWDLSGDPLDHQQWD